MAKKIAAPYKAASKAPAGKKAKAKAISAPKTHKPKGSPKERLAYLNKGEMAALEKRKGSPARRGPKGLPSFADDSASSRGVSRGDKSGTKGSGSTKTATGSVSKGGSYNSGTSGSKGGGASTQSPGMGRNEGRVGPSSPMGGQGTSFTTPKAAREDVLFRGYGIEDRRKLQNMPQQLYRDPDQGIVNPNIPRKEVERQDRAFGDYMKTLQRKSIAQERDTFQKTPQEISEAVRRENAVNAARLKVKEQAQYSNKWPGQNRMKEDPDVTALRNRNSNRLTDIKIGGPREGTLGGYSGGGMGGTYRGGGWGTGELTGGRGGQGWKAGGLVKKNSIKSFKKK